MFWHLVLGLLILPFAAAQNSTNTTNDTCPTLYATLPPESVGWWSTASSTLTLQLATSMTSITPVACPSGQISANYIVVAQAPGWMVPFNGASYAQIISFGGATLCVFVPLEATDTKVRGWGLSPVLDKSRTLIFFFSVVRFASDGSGQNSNEMIVDLIVGVSCDYVLMFSDSNRNGRTIEQEGGKKAMVAALKCRVWLPHTSSVTGYGEGTDSGSSAGLYGLLALIILPVLACLGLICYGLYSWLHYPAGMEITQQAQPQPQPQYAPQAYVPQAYVPQAYMPQAYMPAAYLPRV